MTEPETDEKHIRHCMLVFFDQGLSASKATRTINEIYGPVLSLNKCQFWFRRFKSGDRKLQDAPKSGRPTTFDEDMLRSLIESDPSQSVEELSRKLSSPPSSVHTHLKRIGKVSRMGVWISQELAAESKTE